MVLKLPTLGNVELADYKNTGGEVYVEMTSARLD